MNEPNMPQTELITSLRRKVSGNKSGTILLIGGVLIALRLVFPVMHSVFEGNELCVSHFAPALHDTYADYFSDYKPRPCWTLKGYQPDFTRTLYQATALGVVVSGLLWFLREKT